MLNEVMDRMAQFGDSSKSPGAQGNQSRHLHTLCNVIQMRKLGVFGYPRGEYQGGGLHSIRDVDALRLFSSHRPRKATGDPIKSSGYQHVETVLVLTLFGGFIICIVCWLFSSRMYRCLLYFGNP